MQWCDVREWPPLVVNKSKSALLVLQQWWPSCCLALLPDDNWLPPWLHWGKRTPRKELSPEKCWAMDRLRPCLWASLPPASESGTPCMYCEVMLAIVMNQPYQMALLLCLQNCGISWRSDEISSNTYSTSPWIFKCLLANSHYWTRWTTVCVASTFYT